MYGHAKPLLIALALASMASACSRAPEAPLPEEPVASPPAATAAEAQPAPPPPPALDVDAPPPLPSARAELMPTEGNAATGALTLIAEADGVYISGTLTGVAPGGTHGFHVHEVGDCSAPDASSAGGHFNPAGHAHGHPGQGEHHAGDMPNLSADANGVIQVDLQVPGLTLGDGAASDILGRALVLHAHADDYVSQPAGNAGPRIACGVIR